MDTKQTIADAGRVVAECWTCGTEARMGRGFRHCGPEGEIQIARCRAAGHDVRPMRGGEVCCGRKANEGHKDDCPIIEETV